MANKKVVRLNKNDLVIISNLNHIPDKYCKIICEIGSLVINSISLTLPGEEMQPDKRVSLLSREELIEKLEKNEKISLCKFSCIYNEHINLVIIIDFELNVIKVTCPSGLIDQGYWLIDQIEESIK